MRDLGQLLTISGALGTLLGALGALLGPSWGALGALLGLLGSSWARLGRNLEKRSRGLAFWGPNLDPKMKTFFAFVVFRNHGVNNILNTWLEPNYPSDFHSKAKTSVF